MKNKFRKLIRNVRNVFTNEQEKELSALAREYFELSDAVEVLTLLNEKVDVILDVTPLRSRERYS